MPCHDGRDSETEAERVCRGELEAARKQIDALTRMLCMTMRHLERNGIMPADIELNTWIGRSTLSKISAIAIKLAKEAKTRLTPDEWAALQQLNYTLKSL